MWHPTLNLGKLPADFTHKSEKKGLAALLRLH